jgi:peptide/nickel transport system substrate-binding protein
MWLYPALATLVSAAVGCQGAPPTQKPAEPAQATSAPAAKTEAKPADAKPAAPAASGPVTPKVNRLVLALQTIGTESNDPTEVTPPETWQIRPMYETLLGVDAEGKEPVPMLATGYTLEPDGFSYRFQLRKGVQFHNGFGEMTAKDVRFAYERMIRPDSKHPHASYWKSVVKDMEIVNDYEFVFRLTGPDADFITSVSGAEAVLPIYSKADADSRPNFPTIADKPIAGTGPYQFLERQQSQFIRYQRVPYQHWRINPDFPEFEYRLTKELSTRIAQLKAKEIQIAGLPPEIIGQAEGPGYKIIKSRSAGLQAFLTWHAVYPSPQIRPEERPAVDPSQPFVYMDTPLLDVKVRQALNMAINRDEFNKAFFRGIGEDIYLFGYKEDRPGWNPEWKNRFKDMYGYDPAKARALLAEAGYGPSNPLKTNIILVNTAYFSASGDMSEAISGYWRNIGVDVNFITMDGNARTQQSRQREFNNHGEVVGSSVRQLRGWGIYGTHTAMGTQSGVALPEVDTVFDTEVRKAVEPAKEDAAWRKMGDLAYERFMNIPLHWVPAEAAVDSNIVADYIFPGTITGLYTHPEYIKAAP